MATINVYHDEDNKTYQINVSLKQSFLSPELGTGGAGLTDANLEFYLTINTTIKKVDNTGFGTYVVRSLSDVAPGAGPASSWTELINDYVDYFLTAAEMGMSSSSTSSSSDSSGSSSSSSSKSSSSGSSYSSGSSDSTSSSSEIDGLP